MGSFRFGLPAAGGAHGGEGQWSEYFLRGGELGGMERWGGSNVRQVRMCQELGQVWERAPVWMLRLELGAKR